MKNISFKLFNIIALTLELLETIAKVCSWQQYNFDVTPYMFGSNLH